MKIPSHIIKTKRINLNPVKDSEGIFLNAKYRYVIFPYLKLKDKTAIAKDMLIDGFEIAEINKMLGSKFL
jgi:hypothetical protein